MDGKQRLMTKVMKNDHFFWHPPRKFHVMQYFHWKFKSRPEKHDPFPDSAASFTNKNTIRDWSSTALLTACTLTAYTACTSIWLYYGLRSNWTPLTALTIRALAVLKPTNGQVRVVVELVVLPFHLGASQAILALYPSFSYTAPHLEHSMYRQAVLMYNSSILELYPCPFITPVSF